MRASSAYKCVEDLEGSRFAYNDESSLSGFHCVRFFLQAYLSSNSNDKKTSFFSESIATGSHFNSIMAVLTNKADVLCLDCNVLAKLQSTEDGLELLSQLKHIEVPPLAYRYYRSLKKSCEVDYDDDDDSDSNRVVVPYGAVMGHSTSTHKCSDTVLVSTHDGKLGPNPAQPVVISTRLPLEIHAVIQDAFMQISEEALQHMLASHYVPVDESHYESIARMIEDCAETDYFKDSALVTSNQREELAADCPDNIRLLSSSNSSSL